MNQNISGIHNVKKKFPVFKKSLNVLCRKKLLLYRPQINVSVFQIVICNWTKFYLASNLFDKLWWQPNFVGYDPAKRYLSLFFPEMQSNKRRRCLKKIYLFKISLNIVCRKDFYNVTSLDQCFHIHQLIIYNCTKFDFVSILLGKFWWQPNFDSLWICQEMYIVIFLINATKVCRVTFDAAWNTHS